LIAHYKLDGSEIENPNLVNGSYGDKIKNDYLISRYSFDNIGFKRYLDAGEQCTLTVCFTPTSKFGWFNPHVSGGWNQIFQNISSDGTTNR
jgi:hypothetical protein